MHVEMATATTQATKASVKDLDELRQVSTEVLGSVFYGTLMKTMRESTLKGPYGHGGRGEEIFAAQLDGLLAERMGKSQWNGKENFLFEHLAGRNRSREVTSGTRLTENAS